MEDPTLRIEKEALHANVVRVTIPAKVAFDLKQMQKITESVLDQLGCANCHSGHDIRFDIEKRFIVDTKLKVHSQAELIGR
ncbi:MAG: hypothetical protein KZQ99_05780 [Candidatus Thiodiazotropha sp. (ex Dulcina madagascariensis)]|nr:hypothetical protein [Candidatus Thiodiazotropha sp. (ex Epidulcina cf. delphinae)]MCU7921965.1 hypothetical protein [Candidatus Thiodiazotropha sp. (ex Dulcina madagascariensis)]MCU7927721.1 hypothetical protein [Candidatus Thiodiazotropha sp. (ex Dulcina madagascariensis)]MCU7934377.1 hypothetical protein [Candidatus Thiodiazotropha sp. (ex Dulcina madagascariensis)]